MSARPTASDVVDLLGFDAGEVILFPGPAGNLYRVRGGLVRLHTMDDEGTGLTLRYVKPGGYFGEEAVTGEPRRYFAESVTPTEVEVLDPSNLTPGEHNELLGHLVHALEGLYRGLYRLAGKRLRSRIAAELLELGDSALASINEAGVRVVHITHDDLAAAVGSVRETVTKVVGELSRLGAIDAGYGKIALSNPARLREVAGE